MLRLYDFECQDCRVITEQITEMGTGEVECPVCCGAAHRIISIPGVSTSNDDSEWIRSVVDVVDKKSGKPYDVEFRRNPTRRNLKAWMDGNNLRHIEPGEKAPEPWRPDARFKDKLAQRKMERERVEMR